MSEPLRAELDALSRRLSLTPEGREAVASLIAEIVSRSGASGASPSTFAWHTQMPPGSAAEPTWALPPLATLPAAPASASTLGPYEVLGTIGEGGMGVVYRVLDARLQRPMALKVIRPELVGRPRAVARFVEEAQITAQLQHPGIVPVHELGQLTNGQLYFTMKEIAGRTLHSVIREHHLLGPRAPEVWTRRRLVEALRKVCDAVAYAHARGVVHRDLKPSNIMVGDYGEVLVLDWGLAGLREADAGDAPLVASGDRLATQDGVAPGTPRYMSPEQAAGRTREVDRRSDVYALGLMLYEILVGQAPGRDPTQPWTPWSPAAAMGGVPVELDQVTQRATAPDPRARYPDASALGADIGDWLEGARREDQALQLVAEADALLPEIAALREQAASARARAVFGRIRLQSFEPVEAKRPVWADEDEAERCTREAELRALDWAQRLRGALNLAPDLAAAHARLAQHHRDALAEAERQRDAAAAAQHLRLLAEHDRGENTAWLRGDAVLSLDTRPSQADVTLYRYQLQDRRLVPVFERALGPTPLVDVALPMGSYLLTLRRPGYAEVRYPVALGRGERWRVAPPEEDGPRPVPLPPADALGPDDVYVPPGWFQGGDPMSGPGEEPHAWRWADGVVVRRFPVTNAAYLEFLNALVDEGQEDEALSWVPRERAAAEVLGAMVYGRDADGHFVLRPDADGDLWDPDWPVVNVDWHGALAYSRWLARRDGLPWRLPMRGELQKAARGVDGRVYPWGDHTDPTFACMRESHPVPRIRVVGAFPTDESPYGVRDVGGGVRSWCLEPPALSGGSEPTHVRPLTPAEVDQIPIRTRTYLGGNWSGNPATCRTFNRASVVSQLRAPTTGFRLARSWPG